MRLRRNHLFTLVVCLGSANAVLRPAMEAIDAGDWANALASGFNISSVIWLSLALAIAHFLLAKPNEIRRRDCLIIWSSLMIFLIPSATASWLGLATVAALILLDRQNERRARAGAAILLATAIREPLTNLCLALFAKPILELDATIVALALSLFAEGVRATGNIIEGSNNHGLIVLSGCASFSNLLLALLAWFSLTLTIKGEVDRRSLGCGISLVFVVPSLNYLRLMAMAYDQGGYNFFHSGAGFAVFDIALSGTTFIIILYGVYNGIKEKSTYSLFYYCRHIWSDFQGVNIRKSARLS